MNWSALRRLIVPCLLLIAAILLRQRVVELRPVYRQLVDWLPYVTLFLALAFSGYFNRSRLFTAALALLVAFAVIQMQLQFSLSDPRTLVIYSFLSIAIPAALLLLLLIPERGVPNRYGLVMAGIVPALFGIGWWILRYAPDGAAGLARAWLPLRAQPGYLLAAGASACFAVAFVAGLVVLVRRDSEDEAALLAGLVFCFVTLAFFDRPRISAVMFSGAGLAFIISLVRSSYEMAFRDELTGLLGRRALNDRLKGLAGEFTIAMLDVDHFKQFNDTHGHDVGDDVLKIVARRIERVGGGGTAYRYGGEEFCIVFPGKDIDTCEPSLEAVRRAVACYRLALRDARHRRVPDEVALERRGRRSKPRQGSVSVTISIGVAQADERRRSPEEVVKAADKALYRAKQKGRNCLSW